MASDPMQQTNTPMSAKVFLEWVQKQPERYELIDGEPQMMAGGTPEHATIASNLDRYLGVKLDGKPCRPFTSDYGVNVTEVAGKTNKGKDTIVYPDIVVDCGFKNRPEGQKYNAVLPTCIIEVLSDSTEDFDLGRKGRWYKELTGVEQIVYVDQYKYWVLVITKQPDGSWLDRVPYTNPSDTVDLPALGISLTMAEIYRDITFQA